MERGLRKVLAINRNKSINLLTAGGFLITFSVLSSIYTFTYKDTSGIYRSFSLVLLFIFVLFIGIFLIRESKKLNCSGLKEILSSGRDGIISASFRQLASEINKADCGFFKIHGILLKINAENGKSWDTIIEDSDYIDVYYFLNKAAVNARIETNVIPNLTAENYNRLFA